MTNSLSPHLEFPRAQQAQIIRANQRDLYHVSSLREQAENLLRSWMGSRWLTRWDKEVDLFVKLCYFGLTTGRATQTLGEEYTAIRQYSSSRTFPVSLAARAALVILSVLPPYALHRWAQTSPLTENHPSLAKWFLRIPIFFDVVMEVNLAVFYVRGTYYDLVKRLLGIQQLSSHPHNPYARPPSYSLLGILIAIRLLYRLTTFLRESRVSDSTKGKERISPSTELYLDDRPVSLLSEEAAEDNPAKPAEDDERTALDVTMIPDAIRASRVCTLCLEERTDSCTTECGHMFCWNCIVGWGREKPECPLCRQSMSIDKLLPIYNL